MDMTNKIQKLRESIVKIDDMISRADTDKSIDVDDLRYERKNCVSAIKKLKKYEPIKK